MELMNGGLLESVNNVVSHSELIPKELGLVFPSPSWFCPRVLAVSPDGWLVYGALARGICILQPVNGTYKIYAANHAHADRVSCVTLSDDWLANRRFLTSSLDGVVKQWRLQVEEDDIKLLPINAHNIHKLEKEEVVSALYCGESGVSIGSTGVLVKWDLAANLTRVYKKLLKNLKPTGAAKCPHDPMTVAIGTKQGVLFVVDFHSKVQILYKVRGHDDEITSLSWCPQEEVSVQKAAKFTANKRMESIRNSKTDEEKSEEKEVVDKLKINIAKENEDRNDSQENQDEIVPEDDTFDIYADHEHEEFGHKKFVPEEIYVPVEKTEEKGDFLAECLNLKTKIIENKSKQEQSIHSLVESMKKANINKDSNNVDRTDEGSSSKSTEAEEKNECVTVTPETGVKIETHANLLFTVDKVGKCCLWSKSGKLIVYTMMFRGKQAGHHHGKGNVTCGALHWYRPDLLLSSDGKNVLECNPLLIDSSTKIEFKIVHSVHKRGLYCITSAVPTVQTGNTKPDCDIWSIAQDRNIICYSYTERQLKKTLPTLGGYMYHIQAYPYDANRLAVACGDGNVRVMELSGDVTSPTAVVTCYWQNVQGRITVIAVHPSKESLIAFATAEGRVGLMDTRSNKEKPAKLLGTPLRRGVYSLSWGANNVLFVCSVGELFAYDYDKNGADMVPVEIKFEGKSWNPTEVVWTERGMCIGTKDGEMALATNKPPYNIIATAFCFKKIVQCIAWHPQHVTLSEDTSGHQNLIAVAANQNEFVILKLCQEDGAFKLKEVASVGAHKQSVVRVSWSPHRNGHLLSTSHDATVAVWKVSAEGETSCLSVFDRHTLGALSAEWWPRPEHPDHIMSGGADQTIRLWDLTQFPPHLAVDRKAQKSTQFIMASPENESKKNKKEKIKITSESSPHESDEEQSDTADTETDQMALNLDKVRLKTHKHPLFAVFKKQMAAHTVRGCRRLLRKMAPAVWSGAEGGSSEDEEGTDFVKMFGTLDEFNELMDLEQQEHLSRDRLDLWAVLGVMRGRVDEVFREAAARSALSPALVAIAPMVSHRFWKDQLQAYMAQLDRNLPDDAIEAPQINFESAKTSLVTAYRSLVLLLSQHNVGGAVARAEELYLYREAYVLARARHLDSVARELLDRWTEHYRSAGAYNYAAVCYLAAGKLAEASTMLSKLKDEDALDLASQIAKVTGQETFADSLAKKRDEMSQLKSEELLKSLPGRLELHLKIEQEGANEKETAVQVETAKGSQVAENANAKS